MDLLARLQPDHTISHASTDYSVPAEQTAAVGLVENFEAIGEWRACALRGETSSSPPPPTPPCDRTLTSSASHLALQPDRGYIVTRGAKIELFFYLSFIVQCQISPDLQARKSHPAHYTSHYTLPYIGHLSSLKEKK